MIHTLYEGDFIVRISDEDATRTAVKTWLPVPPPDSAELVADEVYESPKAVTPRVLLRVRVLRLFRINVAIQGLFTGRIKVVKS